MIHQQEPAVAMATPAGGEVRPRAGGMGRWAAALLLLAAVLVSIVATNSPAAAATSPLVTAAPFGLHVSGNQLLDGAGTPVVLRGVDRSGTEYACIQGFGIFDGPSDAASIAAMAAWHINSVRVPLNEDCWLGINNAPAAYSGANYRSAIEGYVSRLHAAGLLAVLDLHWTAAGSAQSTGQQNMPDADHAAAFWTSVATAFQGDGSAVFDLFNEPHDVSWTCWRDGGDCGIGYRVAGMQSLVDAVRSTGARNPVLIGGLAYANDLSSWLTYRPADPTGNLMASWHSYNFNACHDAGCWSSQIAPVSAKVPLVAGEVGENDCAHGYLDAVLAFLDSSHAGYLGWGWDPFDCSSFPALISNYDGTPTSFGIGLRNHLAALAGGPAGTTSTGTGTGATTTGATSSPSSAPVTSATASSPATSVAAHPTPGSPDGLVTVTASALSASAPWWWEEDLSLTPTGAVTALTVTVNVARTSGVGYSGFYTTAPGGTVSTAETTGTNALVYQATLNAGQTLPAGTALRLGAQFDGHGNAHATTGDSYQITAIVNGTRVTASGRF